MSNSIDPEDIVVIKVTDTGLTYEINKGNGSYRVMTSLEIHEVINLIIIDKYYANPLPSTACNNTLT